MYFTFMSMPVWRIVSMQASSGTNRLDRPQTVAFDAGHLNQANSRVAGHAQMMFQRDFGSVFNLFVGAAKRSTQARRRHGCRTAHLTLTADFGSGNAGVVLDQPADCGSG